MLERTESTEEVFKGYRVTNELASTALSRIMLGESLSLTTPHQRVVIKWFPTKYLTTQLEIGQFLQEVITLSGLLHPFILPVLSAGFVKNTPYIIEAYASKGSLLDRLQNTPGRPLPLEETSTILTQLGQALSYVHQRDITHGNLKPQNILFNDQGDVLLADFFLRTLAMQDDNSTVSEVSDYQAPELPPGRASQQGDQYALGCVAYQMVTGHKPFLTPSLSKPGIFYRTNALIPPKHFNPALSSPSEEAILKAVAKEPAQRHKNIDFFLTALGTLTDTGDQATRTAVDPLPSVSDPVEQASPIRVPVRDAIEEAGTFSTPNTSTSSLTQHPAETSVSAEAGELLPNANHTLLGQVFKPSTASMEASKPYTLADYIAHTPDRYPFAHNLLAEASAANPKAISHTSAYEEAFSTDSVEGFTTAHTKPFRTDSLKPFFKRRWVRVAIVCLAAVCIIVMSFLSFSLLPSGQGPKTIPGADTKLAPSSPAPANTPENPTIPSSSTHTPGTSVTPGQSPTVMPSPTSTLSPSSTPTATAQTTPGPTPNPVPTPTHAPIPTPTPTPKFCLPLLC